MFLKLRLLLSIVLLLEHSMYGLSMKGIWSSVENFPLFHSSFWQSFGQSFGASPSGYVYSFDLYNDLQVPVYCSINEIISFMGGNLPKPHGCTMYTVPAGKFISIKDQSYYFEMLIKSTPRRYSSNMPYLQHDDVIGRFEGLTLPDQTHSTQKYFYRTFVKRAFKNGSFVHSYGSECVGYQNPSSSKNAGTVMVASQLSSLTIFNSSDQNYYVGFSKQISGELTEQSCALFELIPAHSFGLLSSFGAIGSLTPGSIGLFDATTKNLVTTFVLPTNIFQTLPSKQSKNYTLEIYQDALPDGQLGAVAMNLQGVMPGNFDQPIGSVRDITPVTCVFWNQVATSKGSNLPGKVWMIMQREGVWSTIAGVAAGSAVQYNLSRPNFDKSLWIYFVYVDEIDDAKAQEYLLHLQTQSFGQQALNLYHQQAAKQEALAKQAGSTSTVISQDMLVAASQGVLSLHGGQIQDPATGTIGYLLGADVFFSRGVGSGPMYYVLAFSSLATTQPVQTVQNYFVATVGSTQAPQGMPTPTMVTV